MNKKLVLQKVIAHLTHELERYHRAARAAFEEATDEHNKSENKYDTRGLEASYLARGQARQVAETEQAIAQFMSLTLQALGPADQIALGAYVELERGKDKTQYFIGPCAGGMEVSHAGRDIVVITPQSPLGRQLIGRREGDLLKLEMGGARQEHRVARVS